MEKILKGKVAGTMIENDLRQHILREYLKRVEWRVNDGWKIRFKDATGNVINEKIAYKALNNKELSVSLGTKQLTGTFEILVGDETIGVLSVNNGVIQ